MSIPDKYNKTLSNLSYGLLGLSTLGALFLPDEHHVYCSLTTAAAVASGWSAGHIKIPGVVSLLAYTLILREACRATDSTVKHGLMLATIILNIGFGLHKIPGFRNKPVIVNEELSSDAIPFTLYWNVDKMLAGIIPLILGSNVLRDSNIHLSKEIMPTIALTSAATIGMSTLLAIDLDLIRFNPGFKKHFPMWSLTNLIGVVPTEEVTFRLLIQSYLESVAGSHPGLIISSLLFGAAHYPGGKAYATVTACAGLGYGYAFQKGGLNAAILLHFALNLTHFLGFTYPMLKPSTTARPSVIGEICNFFRNTIINLPRQEMLFENDRRYLSNPTGSH